MDHFEVLVVEGRDIPTHMFRTTSPYVSVVVGGKKLRTQPDAHGGKHPRWGETLIFDVQGTVHGLQVTVRDAHAEEKPIGTSRQLNIESMCNGEQHTVELEIFSQSGNPHGYVTIKCRYIPDMRSRQASLPHSPSFAQQQHDLLAQRRSEILAHQSSQMLGRPPSQSHMVPPPPFPAMPEFSAPYPPASSGYPPSSPPSAPYPGSYPSGGGAAAPYPPTNAPYPPSAAQFHSGGGYPAPYPSSGTAPYPSGGLAPYPPSGAAPYPSGGAALYPPGGHAPYPPSGAAPYPSGGMTESVYAPPPAQVPHVHSGGAGVVYGDANAKNVLERKTSFKGVQHANAIRDEFASLQEVQKALQRSGLESSQLILGVDYTASNTSQGMMTFGGRCLHEIRPGVKNPYQTVIEIIGRTLEAFDEDKLIPTFGFGDRFTMGEKCFPFYPEGVAQGFEQVLERYNEITPGMSLAGPTNFAPIIREAIKIVKEVRQYHILVIIADGQVTPDNDYQKSESETREAIITAANYALSIVVVGVGDGPWKEMEEFDDGLPTRRFDNFQFVSFHEVFRQNPHNPEFAFATAALQEIPEQYKNICRLGLLG